MRPRTLPVRPSEQFPARCNIFRTSRYADLYPPYRFSHVVHGEGLRHHVQNRHGRGHPICGQLRILERGQQERTLFPPRLPILRLPEMGGERQIANVRRSKPFDHAIT